MWFFVVAAKLSAARLLLVLTTLPGSGSFGFVNANTKISIATTFYKVVVAAFSSKQKKAARLTGHSEADADEEDDDPVAEETNTRKSLRTAENELLPVVLDRFVQDLLNHSSCFCSR